MKFTPRLFLVATVLVTASMTAFAHDVRFGTSIFYGNPYSSFGYSPYGYGGGYYGRYDDYYDRRPIIITPPVPLPPSDVIVDSATGPRQYPSYRNYCADSGAWFPQVKACIGGWQLR
jgi:hypothetical protein